MKLFEYINLGEHAIKIYHDGMVVIYETPTGGDSILLVKDQTCELFTFLAAHSATFQGEEREMSGVDPYDWELRYPGGRPSTTRAVQLSLDGLILFEGATTFELKKLEVINLYNFLVAHRETFLQKNEKQAHRR